ncbi:sigma-70 family RNA polymerase sigma factor [Devosia sp.]|uniref:sigma-70 family RNA polymerase sigma factor n=1 Tax=Devosia sp. TaxID=1871048 RepID=UPI0025C17E20|nr:sigma-70 family RNA polymerase sigma factor [Devosia sp.]
MSVPSDMEAHLRPLMLKALDGDAAAYRALLEELRRHLRVYFARRLAPALAANGDDLVQETLMAIHTRRLTYDRAQPFTAWLHAIARYKLIDHFRRNKLRMTLPLEEDAAIFATDDSEATSARMDVETVLATIPGKPAELIRQTRLEGASVAEAAARLGMTETAAKVSIHRGLKSLAARFGGKADG